MGEIVVCIGNWGAYANGYLIDRWAELPMEPGDLARLLSDMQAENADLGAGEEFYISDYDGTPFGIGYSSRGPFSEDAPIEHLNLLAKLMELHPGACKVVEAALDTGCDCPDDVLGLANWILQADDIPLYSYGLDQDAVHATTPAEKMGLSWAIDSGLFDALEKADAVGCFDFGAYGEAIGNDCFLGEDGYIDGSLDMPDEDRYDWDDIREMTGFQTGEELRNEFSPAVGMIDIEAFNPYMSYPDTLFDLGGPDPHER